MSNPLGSEVSQQARGNRAGGMDPDAIVRRLEVTDPAAIACCAPRGAGLNSTGCEYNDFARMQMVFNSVDPPFLESDRPNRNPNRSRGVLNLQYNGAWGNSSGDLLPRAEGLFGAYGDRPQDLGFHDPRGVDGQPRLDKARRQNEIRMRYQEARFGTQSTAGSANGGAGTDTVAERPVTGPEIQRHRVETHEAVRGRLKVFRVAKDGRSVGRNVVTDANAVEGIRLTRELQRDGGREHHTAYAGGSSYGPDGRDDRRAGNGHGARRPGRGGTPRTKDGAALQKFRAGTQDGELAVARYSKQGQRVQLVAPSGPARREPERAAQQDFGRAAVRDGVNKSMLVRAMASGAEASRTCTVRDADRADGDRFTAVAGAVGRNSAQKAQADVSQIYQKSSLDGDLGRSQAAPVTGQDSGGALAGAKAVAPSAAFKAAGDQDPSILAQAMAQPGRQQKELVAQTLAGKGEGTQDPAVVFAAATPQKGSAPSNKGGNDAARQKIDASRIGPAAADMAPATNYSKAAPLDGHKVHVRAHDGYVVSVTPGAAKGLQTPVYSGRGMTATDQTQSRSKVESRERVFQPVGSVSFTRGVQLGGKRARADRHRERFDADRHGDTAVAAMS